MCEIEKIAVNDEITSVQKEMIKRFLPRDERNDYINWKDYYVFKIILCNNDVDKDHDKFSIQTLYQIRDMAIGKNGILDTMPNKENKFNIARIFDCSVEYDKGKTTIDGEPLFYVQAYAFLDKRISDGCGVIAQKIKEGFYNEISVGCSIYESHKASLFDSELAPEYEITVIDSIADLYEWAIVQKPDVLNCPLKRKDGKCLLENMCCYLVDKDQCNKLKSAYYKGKEDNKNNENQNNN